MDALLWVLLNFEAERVRTSQQDRFFSFGRCECVRVALTVIFFWFFCLFSFINRNRVEMQMKSIGRIEAVETATNEHWNMESHSGTFRGWTHRVQTCIQDELEKRRRTRRGKWEEWEKWEGWGEWWKWGEEEEKETNGKWSNAALSQKQKKKKANKNWTVCNGNGN